MLSRFTFSNVVTTGLNLKEYKWVEDFIRDYSKFLDDKHRESFVHFNVARLHYEKKEYDKAMRLFAQSDYDDLLMSLNAKTMLLKMYYELDEMNALESLLGSMRTFLQRKKVMGYHKSNYKNILHFTKKLLRTTAYGKEQKEKLRHEIELGSVWIKQLLADASTVYVAYKKADGTNDYIAAAYELSSGKELWRTPVPGVQSMFPGTLAKGHVLLNCPVTRRPPGGGAVDWVPTIVAIDKKTGVESGRIEGRAEATPTYSLSIAPGRVVIAEGDTVEAWGR